MGAFIINKVYFDAYNQESTGGVGKNTQRFTKAINENVENGVLILNYVGHANNRYLAHEQVLNVSDINSWSNSNNLPIFVTATCEFSRYDCKPYFCRRIHFIQSKWWRYRIIFNYARSLFLT